MQANTQIPDARNNRGQRAGVRAIGSISAGKSEGCELMDILLLSELEPTDPYEQNVQSRLACT
jgi:hypothetical protein